MSRGTVSRLQEAIFLSPNIALRRAVEGPAPRGVPSTRVDIAEAEWLKKERLDLSGRLIAAQEEERARISRELHDDVGQRITLLIIELRELALRLGEPGSAIDEQLQHLCGSAKEIGSAVSKLSHKLHPAFIGCRLEAALHNLCGSIEQRGLVVQFTARGILNKLPDNVSLCLYRVAQEALTNVLKHSGAREAQVEIVGEKYSVRMRVTDFGHGFDPKSSSCHSGLGLLSMKERVQLVGGEFTVKTRPSGGTEINVRVPVWVDKCGTGEA